MAGLTEPQRRFVELYLGADLPDGASGRDATALLPAWQDAKDAVDDQLRSLSDSLRKSAYDEVVGVADEVETLLEPVRVRITTALMEYDRNPAEAAKRKAALDAISAAGDWLASDARVKAVDSNPWGVPVSVAATLGAALFRLENDVARSGSAAE